MRVGKHVLCCDSIEFSVTQGRSLLDVRYPLGRVAGRWPSSLLVVGAGHSWMLQAAGRRDTQAFLHLDQPYKRLPNGW